MHAILIAFVSLLLNTKAVSSKSIDLSITTQTLDQNAYPQRRLSMYPERHQVVTDYQVYTTTCRRRSKLELSSLTDSGKRLFRSIDLHSTVLLFTDWNICSSQLDEGTVYSDLADVCMVSCSCISASILRTVSLFLSCFRIPYCNLVSRRCFCSLGSRS